MILTPADMGWMEPGLSLATGGILGDDVTQAPAEVFGVLRRWNGSDWVPASLKVYQDGAFVPKPLKAWDGSAWRTVMANG